VKQGDRLEVESTHLVASGDGVATVDGVEVRVPGLLPGERGRVRITHRSRQRPLAHAVLEARTRADPARRAPPCRRHPDGGGRCGGCPLMALPAPTQRARKRAMLARLDLPVAEVEARPDGDLQYRRSSKRVAWTHRGRLVLGSWERGTHAGVSMAGCRVDHPRIVELAREVEEAANRHGVAAYDEPSGQGALRAVWLKTDGERTLVTVVTATEEARGPRAIADAISADGVAWSVLRGSGNALRGGPATVLRGLDRLRLAVAGVGVEVGPLGFLQPNPEGIADAYRALVADARGEPLTGAVAWDLFAGAGVTRALLAQTFEEVVPVESHPESAAALGVAAQTAEAFLGARTIAPDLVILNPPRKGLGEAVVAELRRLAPPRIHVMSCGPEGLRRDLDGLAEGYVVEGLRAFDTLPQTLHLELVAHLTRR
jgi:23S rRNA (uracil1939-C5)-methyltransferase